MKFEDECCKEYTKFKNEIVNPQINKIYNSLIEKLYKEMYILNYITHRIEVSDYFENDYYNVSFSCFIESLVLLSKNFTRASSLVLRSGIENFLKLCIYDFGNKKYNINDRIYNENKKTLSNIAKLKNEEEERHIECLNSRLESKYSELSGLSHSLTLKSMSDIYKYILDVNKINLKELLDTINIFDNVIDAVLKLCILISKESLKLWNSEELGNMFSLIWGKRYIKTILEFIKNN